MMSSLSSALSSLTSSGNRVEWPGSLVLMPIEVGVVFNRLFCDLTRCLEECADVDVETEVGKGGGEVDGVIREVREVGSLGHGLLPVNSGSIRIYMIFRTTSSRLFLCV